MTKARGIHAHDFFKLGKGPAKRDKRNLMLAHILQPVPAKLPDSYDYDVDGAGVAFPMRMFGNDTLGDCVMASRANQTLRFEQAERKKSSPSATRLWRTNISVRRAAQMAGW